MPDTSALACDCSAIWLDTPCPVHGETYRIRRDTDSGNPWKDRYNLRCPEEEIHRAIDAQKHGESTQAITHLGRAIASLMDYIRAKERGDI